MITLSYYPGCSMKTSSKFYETSLKEVFSFYGIGLEGIGRLVMLRGLCRPYHR